MNVSTKMFYLYFSFCWQGENLDLISLKNDILVIVGNSFCNVTLIGTTVLLCAPDKPENLIDAQRQEVKVR